MGDKTGPMEPTGHVPFCNLMSDLLISTFSCKYLDRTAWSTMPKVTLVIIYEDNM